jgi:hypothetical protein
MSDSLWISRRGMLLVGIGGVASVALTACAPVPWSPDWTPKITPTPRAAPSLPPTPTPAPVKPMNAADYGVVGDGVADDAVALQTLLNRAAAARVGVVLATKSRLRLGTTINVPTNTQLNGNDATVVNATSGAGGRIFVLELVENITIENLNFDGAKTMFSAVTEQRHNLVLSGARNVTLNALTSYHAKGDGLYIGDQSSGPSVNVTLINSSFAENYRQGMSVTCASGLTVTACQFKASAGTAPGAGVDIEPNTDGSVIEGLLFQDCTFEGNAGGGLLISLRPLPSARQESGSYVGCSFMNNPRSSGIVLANSRGARFSGGAISGNAIDGMTIHSATDTTLASITMARNGRAGIQTVGSYSSLAIDRTVFNGNGIAQPSGGFGINSTPPAGHNGVGLRVTNCRFVAMHGGIQTNAACMEVFLDGNQYSGVAVDQLLASKP